jgi:hypothetical protein
LAVKLLLEKEGIYTFSHRELGACHALDKLLNANGWRSNWSDILSTEEARAELAYSIREAARTNLPSRSSA